MSKLILWGSSALDFYQHGDFTSLLTLWLDIAHQEDITPNAAAVQYLEDRLPWLSKPFRIIVPSRQQKRNLKDVRCHVAEASIQQDRYFRTAQGLFAPSPEVAFLQSNWSHDLAEVIFKGSTLCGAYGLTPPFDTVFNRPVLTSSERIQEALLAHRDIRGCAMTRRAAPWILDNAASPREAALALLMTLPNHLGGYHFARPRLNHSIELTGAARPLSRKEYYVADVCWPAQRLILEYDSDERHLTSEQLQEDAVKRMTLQAMNYRIITVGRLQLNSTSETRKIALSVARALGKPIRFRIGDFDAKHKHLREVLGLPSWQ